ncbi:MAG: hypothetical protein IPG60_08605 [Bacteroidetes bacterium]|nr:hypothetical protein [Bacteroidota bacterium]MBP7400445.1 hypothetical protein [Chitinophagales bacterium]MBK8487979.1 hypothetical protein [Bacteroidota bacterium]MBK8682263.1 hypothetical protein [Bacteroidota bacterium]MBP8753771.1 hypothetical protein [Chitinophagales bacterium]
MRQFIFISAILVFTTNIFSQNSTELKLEKVFVKGCGCSVYLPPYTPPFDLAYSEDSSQIYTTEYSGDDNYYFGVIAVKLAEPIGDNVQEKELLITRYLDFIKTLFEIHSSTGYVKGQTLDSKPNVVGVIDSWQDKQGYKYSVQSWTDGNKIGVLYIAGPGEYPNQSVRDLFLNGFDFD